MALVMSPFMPRTEGRLSVRLTLGAYSSMLILITSVRTAVFSVDEISNRIFSLDMSGLQNE